MTTDEDSFIEIKNKNEAAEQPTSLASQSTNSKQPKRTAQQPTNKGLRPTNKAAQQPRTNKAEELQIPVVCSYCC